MNEKAKKIVEVIEDVIDDEDVQPRYPAWNDKTGKFDLTEYANGAPVTWCNRALHRMLVMLGGKVELLLKPQGINFTNANAMVLNARANLIPVREEFAQNKALEGELVVALAYNKEGSGHVALVCPNEEKLLVGQAGVKNGIMTVKEGFGTRLTVEYYAVPYSNEGIGG